MVHPNTVITEMRPEPEVLRWINDLTRTAARKGKKREVDISAISGFGRPGQIDGAEAIGLGYMPQQSSKPKQPILPLAELLRPDSRRRPWRSEV
ncbi:hypothetical protein GUJ93_ZPchr0009g1277 [Zizania palustris]|uniref:Uncharacterized protein n=1 Tax=Zizania palustris TaxID=103762 RepID=A0A8J5S5A1_ZIZPA|nr:hypothetical protein GUJ93_ZPchr0009g1277 [Zizania palustris]